MRRVMVAIVLALALAAGAAGQGRDSFGRDVAWWAAGSAADNATTYAALHSGRFVEGNLIGRGSRDPRVVVPLNVAFSFGVGAAAWWAHKRYPESRIPGRVLRYGGWARLAVAVGTAVAVARRR